jgi:hypothetical protein
MLNRTLLTVLFATSVFAQTPHPLTAELEKIRMPVSLKEGRLTGAGAELLHKELAATQFFMIGEEHGTAEIPRFHKALLQEAWKNGYRHVAIEVGPLSLARVASFEDAAKSNLEYPFGYPFLSWKEDAEVFDAAMKLGGGRRDTVWGIDQEFLFYATAHLARLVELAKTDAQRAAAMKALERSRAADAELLATRNPSKLMMLAAAAAELDELRTAFKGGDAAAVKLIEALDESRVIYQMHGVSGWQSNDTRAALIKRLFSDAYASAVARGEKHPKVMLRLGATHLMRGRSMTNVYDIGSMLPEVAALNGTRSFQILVIPKSGFTNEYRPMSQSADDKRKAYDPAKALPFDGKPLFDAAPAGEWSLFDLRAIRTPLVRKKLEPLEERLRDVLWGFDAILVMPDVTPATLFD